MTSIESKADLLVINLDDYSAFGLEPYIQPHQLSLLAANLDGQIFARYMMYTATTSVYVEKSLETEDIDGDIVSFLAENFENGMPIYYAAAQLELLLKCLKQNATVSCLALRQMRCLHLDALVASLPDNSLVKQDYTNGRSGGGRTIEDTFSTLLILRPLELLCEPRIR